jgi:hypothetical protein
MQSKVVLLMPDRYAVNKTKKSHRKIWAFAAVVLLLVALSGTYWRLRIYKPASEVITTAGLPNQTANQDSSANSSPATKTPANNSAHSVGGGTDTNGQSQASTSPDQWITAKSGLITVQQPTVNAIVRNGDILSGTAKVGTINFRLIDNSVGVISTGSLNVVNGKFSGKLGFTPHSTTGRLDVFSTEPDGTEINEIQIAVRF